MEPSRAHLGLVAVSATAIAVVLHVNHVEYRHNASNYLLSRTLPNSHKDAYLDELARHQVEEPYSWKRVDVDAMNIYQERFRDKYCSFTDAYDELSRTGKYFAAIDDERYWTCSKPFNRERVAKLLTKTHTYAGVTFQEARDKLEAKWRRRPLRYGMVPNRATGTSQAAGLWLGLIVPLALLTVAAGLFYQAVFSWLRNGRSSEAKGRKANPSVEAYEPTPIGDGGTGLDRQTEVLDLIKQRYGIGFPVSSGKGTEQEPFIVTATDDYVSYEYVVAKALMESEGKDCELAEQILMRLGDRAVDRLVFRVRDASAVIWEQQAREFYFDITRGYTKTQSAADTQSV